MKSDNKKDCKNLKTMGHTTEKNITNYSTDNFEKEFKNLIKDLEKIVAKYNKKQIKSELLQKMIAIDFRNKKGEQNAG